MALGNVCMTKQRKEMGVQTLQYVFFLEKQNKTETGTKLKRKPQNNETKPRVENYYGKVTRAVQTMNGNLPEGALKLTDREEREETETRSGSGTAPGSAPPTLRSSVPDPLPVPRVSGVAT